MFWRDDPQYDAARKLPEWGALHRLCQQDDFYFDRPERDGKKYHAVAFAVEYLPPAPQRYRVKRTVFLAEGWGATFLDSIAAAYRATGRDVPGVSEMLARGLAGLPRNAAPAADEFAALLAPPPPIDEFAELM